MRIKIQTNALASAAAKIKLERERVKIAEISKTKRVLPINFLTLYKWNDGYEVRGRIGQDSIELQVSSLEEGLIFIKDNL